MRVSRRFTAGLVNLFRLLGLFCLVVAALGVRVAPAGAAVSTAPVLSAHHNSAGGTVDTSEDRSAGGRAGDGARDVADAFTYWTMGAMFRGAPARPTQPFQATFSVRTSSTATQAQAAARVRTVARQQGYQTVKTTRVPVKSKGYRAFTYRNIRYNLSVRSGATRLEHDSHHVYPNKFRGFFEKRGINIDAPANLRWWWRPSHKSKAFEYNKGWGKFIRDNPRATRAQVEAHGAKMDRAYSRHYERPGPRGCAPQLCRDTLATR